MPPLLRRLARLAPALTVGAGLALSCSRSGLELGDYDYVDGDDAAVPTAGTGGQKPKPDAQAQICTPTEEVCNGADDDCDGLTDEVSPIACPDGGEKFCVGGAWSACPERCETCMPGSERVCFLSYCKYWAVQTCTADGKTFGKCHEEDPPPECNAVAKDKKYSPELEQCCIDNGYCCRDTFDLDDDGNTGEMLGDCEDVICKP